MLLLLLKEISVKKVKMIQLKNELIMLNHKNEELEAENTRLKGTSKEPTKSSKVQNLLH